LTGRFCARCGAPADQGSCASCGTTLSPGARFCHRCGAPAAGQGSPVRRERIAWIVAGTVIILTLLAVAWRAGGGRPTVPDMGNAGNVGLADTVPALAGRAPDISSLSPQQRFDRLWERVMRAAEGGDSVTVLQFAPMALGAYAMLDQADNDTRYHAATIQLLVGDLAAVRGLADSILADAPGHLFGYVLRGEAAERGNRTAELTQSYRDFLDHEAAELRAGRREYADHKPVLDDFRNRARASLGQ
jgi:hypothetical protein